MLEHLEHALEHTLQYALEQERHRLIHAFWQVKVAKAKLTHLPLDHHLKIKTKSHLDNVLGLLTGEDIDLDEINRPNGRIDEEAVISCIKEVLTLRKDDANFREILHINMQVLASFFGYDASDFSAIDDPLNKEQGAVVWRFANEYIYSDPELIKLLEGTKNV